MEVTEDPAGGVPGGMVGGGTGGYAGAEASLEVFRSSTSECRERTSYKINTRKRLRIQCLNICCIY